MGAGGGGGGDAAPPPPPPHATHNAVKLKTDRILANVFMLLVQYWQQPGDPGVLRGVFRGFPSPSFGGFGFVVVIV